MLKISQNTFLRALSVSCLCLSLSSSHIFAMDENTEKKPSTPAATFATVVKGDIPLKNAEAREPLPLSRPFFPLSDEDRAISQTLFERLKTFAAPEDQKPLFETINAGRVSINALFEKLDLLLKPPSSSEPHSVPSATSPASPPQDKKDLTTSTTNLLRSSNSEIVSIAQSIKTIVDTLVDSLRNRFGLTITYLSNPRVSESFYKGTIERFVSAAQSEASQPSHLWDLFCKEEESHSKKYEEIIQDAEKLYLWQPTRLQRAKYYLTEEWKDLKVLTITPYNFHLYAAMMEFLDDSYTRLGLLQDGKSLVEGALGFKYGPYDKRYVGAYVLQRQARPKEVRS